MANRGREAVERDEMMFSILNLNLSLSLAMMVESVAVVGLIVLMGLVGLGPAMWLVSGVRLRMAHALGACSGFRSGYVPSRGLSPLPISGAGASIVPYHLR